MVQYNMHNGNEALRRAFTTQAPSEGKILRLDRHTLRVDGSQVGVLEQRDKVSLSGFLQRHDSRRLEAEVGLTTPRQHPTDHMTNAHNEHDSP